MLVGVPWPTFSWETGVKREVKNLEEESYRPDDFLNVVVATCDGHDLGEQNQVVCGGGEDTKTKENGEEKPLPDVAQDVARGVLSMVVGLSASAVSLQLLQPCK